MKEDKPLKGVIVELTVTIPMVHFLDQERYGRLTAEQAFELASREAKGRYGQRATVVPKFATWVIGEREVRKVEGPA